MGISDDKDKIKIIYLCKKCGDVIDRATKYQIRQDYCYYCFKKMHRRRHNQKLL